jgi:hypothetical protein
MAKSSKTGQIAPGDYTMQAKVSDKGAVSIYGLQRFPVTLYADQWLAILARKEQLLKFISDNASELKGKAESAKSVEGASKL